jgi:septation ring formation regulator
MMIYIFLGIIIVALLAYFGVILAQHRNSKTIDQLQSQEQALNEIPVQKAVSEARNLKLTGQSKKTFTALEKQFKTLNEKNIATIDELLYTAETANNHYHFLQTQQMVKQVTEQLAETEQAFKDVLAGFETIIEQVDENNTKLKELEKTYQKLRKQILTKSFVYGPAIDQLELKLRQLEKALKKYRRVTAAGDYDEAAEILKTQGEAIETLDKLMVRIPDRYKETKTEFPDQLRELRHGYDELAETDYQFYDIDIPKELDQIEQDIDATNQSLKTLDLERVETDNQAIAQRIDHLYDVMEAEIKARQSVEKRNGELSAFFKHANQQNRSLYFELDHLDQSYHLNHDEISQCQDLKSQIDDLANIYQTDMDKITQKQAVYSMINDNFDTAFAGLTKIEEQQKALNDSVQGMQKGEREAQKSLQSFEFELRNIKRQVEKLNLPGLNQKYLDTFFMVSDELKALDEALNQTKINLDEITKALITTQEDLDHLKEDTNDMIDSALLAEQMMQYANRYRHSHADVATASEQAFQKFEKDYDYKGALETIATVLEQIEPGSYKKVEDSYYNSKDQELNV